MKKLLALVMAILMCLCLCACDPGTEAEDAKSPEETVESKVRSQIMAEIILTYDTEGVPTITSYVNQRGENTYEVTGKVTVKDKYGDYYTGKYDAEVEYDPETGYCDVDLDLGTLYKD